MKWNPEPHLSEETTTDSNDDDNDPTIKIFSPTKHKADYAIAVPRPFVKATVDSASTTTNPPAKSLVAEASPLPPSDALRPPSHPPKPASSYSRTETRFPLWTDSYTIVTPSRTLYMRPRLPQGATESCFPTRHPTATTAAATPWIPMRRSAHVVSYSPFTP